MGKNTIQGHYVVSGDNPSIEIQDLWLDINYNDVAVSGGTATVQIDAVLWVRRDNYGPSNRTATAYIACDGYSGSQPNTSSVTQKFVLQPATWLKVHQASWTLTYNASESKTISFRAGFDMPGNRKLRGLVLPAYQYGYGSATQEGDSLSITFGKQTSNCTPPSYLGPDKGFITVEPKTQVYFSWSGANGGINNPIWGYQLFYAEGYWPNESSYDSKYELSAGESQTWITVGSSGGVAQESSRGKTCYIALKAIGTVSGYDSDLAYASICQINTRPSTPSGQVSSNIVPSTGGEVTFYLTPGSDKDNQNYTVWGFKNGGDAFLVESGHKEVIKENTNFKFYTWDGLAYSVDSLNFNITVNQKPEIVSVDYPQVSLKSDLLLTEAGRSMKYVLNATPSNIQTNKTSVTYKYYIRYGKYDQIDYNSYTDSSIELFQLNDVRQKIGLSKWYKIGIKANDGVEDSNIYWFPAGDKPNNIWDENTYCIPSPPKLLGMYNQYDNKNLPGANKEHFYRNVRFVFTYDEGFNQISKVVCINGQQESMASLHTLIHDSRGYVQDIIAPEGLIGGQRYKFKITFRQVISNNETYGITLETPELMRVPTISLTKLTIDINAFKPYSQLELKTAIKINKWFAENTVPYSDYSLIQGQCFKFGLNANSYTDASGLLTNPVLSGDYITFEVNHSTLYSNLPEGLNKNGSNRIYLIFNIVNAFGVKSRRSIEIIVDYREPCVAKNNALLVGNTDFMDLNELKGANKFLKEGMPMFYSGTILSYNGIPSIQIQIKRSNQDEWQNYGSPFELDSGTMVPEPGQPTEYSITKHIIIDKIGEIIPKEYTSSFQILVTNQANISISKQIYENIKVCGHTQANIVANNIIYEVVEDTHTFKSLYSCDNLGVINTGTTLAVQLEYRLINQADVWRNIAYPTSLDTFLGTYKPANFINTESDKNAWNAVVARFKVTTINSLTLKKDTFKTEKITYSNEIIVYNLVPTVSYRKNYLGVNIKDLTKFNNDAVLAVSEYTDRSKIYLFSAKNGIRTIDINTGEMDNFTIDGGEW